MVIDTSHLRKALIFDEFWFLCFSSNSLRIIRAVQLCFLCEGCSDLPATEDSQDEMRFARSLLGSCADSRLESGSDV